MSKRKKHNYEKRFERMARVIRFVHKKSFGMNEDGEHILKITLYRPQPAVMQHYHKTARQLMDSQRRWSIEVFVECIDDQGEMYIESAEFQTDDRCKLDDITPLYHEHKDELFNAINTKHYSDSGWIARII